MSKQAILTKKIGRYLLEPRWLLVLYAIFDLAWTWIRMQRLTAEMVAVEISPIRSPLSMMTDSFLLLLAVAGFWFGRLWSYLAAIIASIWLLYHGLSRWQLIASAIEAPMWSWSVLRHWLVYDGAIWDFPRYFVAIFLVAFGTIVLLTRLRYRSDGKPNSS